MLEVIQPSTFILVPVSVFDFTITVGLVVLKVTDIYVAIVMIHRSEAMRESIVPFTFVTRPVRPCLLAFSMPDEVSILILLHLSRVNNPFLVLTH